MNHTYYSNIDTEYLVSMSLLHLLLMISVCVREWTRLVVTTYTLFVTSLPLFPCVTRV